MTLSALIWKRDSGNLATAIPAISATQPEDETATVARIATVAVADPEVEETELPVIRPDSIPMTVEEEAVIRAWMALIEETDLASIAEVIGKCRCDIDARAYFYGMATAELPKPEPVPDDRRTCDQCMNLVGGRCYAAKRREIAASGSYEPIRNLLRRCEGYAPTQDDPDRRNGRERWPELTDDGGIR